MYVANGPELSLRKAEKEYKALNQQIRQAQEEIEKLYVEEYNSELNKHGVSGS